jgi:hypothetical protein
MYYTISKLDAAIEQHLGEEALDLALGHDYTNGNDWGPDDLVIAPDGRLGQIRYNGEFYEHTPTDEIADVKRLREIAATVLRKRGLTSEEVETAIGEVNGVSDLSEVVYLYPLSTRLFRNTIRVVVVVLLLGWLVLWFLLPTWLGRAVS